MTAPSAISTSAQPGVARRVSFAALVPGALAVALMLVWAEHNGGYDADTWYWGALLMLSALGAVLIMLGPRNLKLSRRSALALAALASYVAWSYLSILWAQSPGDALDGSNRALLYLLLFAVLLILPWDAKTALLALLCFVLGVGIIAIVLLGRLASGNHVGDLVIHGRLAAPTGYFNATAALFTIDALTAIALAARRELPGLLRGVLVAVACAGLQVGVIVQSRGWLFTLPVLAIIAVLLARERGRFLLFALIPVAGALVPLHRLLHVFQASSTALRTAAMSAGRAALLLCFVALVLGTMAAWADSLIRVKPLGPTRQRMLGVCSVLLTVAVCAAGATVATHGHPFRFISRQWNGFSRVETSYSKGSHFGDVGSGRYDFWRVSLDAFVAHPIGGLGQDNFDNFYIRRGRTGEEPKWTHSLEMRLLAHTGIVGALLFATFLIALLAGAIGGLRSRDRLTGGVCAAALMPMAVWLVHGSVDWFWEIPALTAPALGFAAIASSLGGARSAGPEGTDAGASAGAEGPDMGGELEPGRAGAAPQVRARSASKFGGLAGAVAASSLFVALAVVLAFSYLSVRETSRASDIRDRNPAAALRSLQTAADLNPLSAVPSRLAGTIALHAGMPGEAEQRFRQAIDRDPGGWFAWFGAGLAASALGHPATARSDLRVAASINSHQPAITTVLAGVNSGHALTPTAGLRLLLFAQ